MVSDVKRKHIQGVIKDFEITKENWENEIYNITMQIPMGKLVKLFVNRNNDGPTPSDVQTNYTGVVIDARGVDLLPAIFINIYNKSGKKICGPTHTAYSATGKNIEEFREKRLGNNPLRILARNTSGKNKVDIVISDEDAVRMKKQHSLYRCLLKRQGCYFDRLNNL